MPELTRDAARLPQHRWTPLRHPALECLPRLNRCIYRAGRALGADALTIRIAQDIARHALRTGASVWNAWTTARRHIRFQVEKGGTGITSATS